MIGYYEGWNLKKKCGTMTPEEIPVHSLTHLIFSFGFIAPGTFKIENMVDFEPSLFGRVTDLKQKKPSLKVLIALGVCLIVSLELFANEVGLDPQ